LIGLEDVDAEHKSNLVARTNVSGFYMVPAVTVATTRRTYGTLAELKSTTLTNLRIEGSTLLRVTHKELKGVTLPQALGGQDAKVDGIPAPTQPPPMAPQASASPKEPVPKKQKTTESAPIPNQIPQVPPTSTSRETGGDEKVITDESDTKTPPPSFKVDEKKLKKINNSAADKGGVELSVRGLGMAINRLAKATEDAEELTVALQTLRRIVSKILKTKAEKFRSLKLSSPRLNALLGRHDGAAAVLLNIGFVPYRKTDGLHYVLRPEKEDPGFIKKALEIISEELVLAKAPAESSKPSSQPGEAGPGASFEGPAEDFDWEKEKKKKEDEKIAAEEAKKPKTPNLLEHTRVVEEMSFDWEKNKDEKGAPVNQVLTPREDILDPEYNLADVRTALSRLRLDCSKEDEATGAQRSLESMRLLRAITVKLQARPKKPQYRKLKLTSKTVRQKITERPGAMAYLTFLGFKEKEKGILYLPEKNEMDIKISRALSILTRVYQEIQIEVPLFTLEQRQIKVYDTTEVDERSYARLPKEKIKSDAQIVKESFREAKLKKALEGKILERERLRRKYDKTVVRVVFRGDKAIVQALFSPNERALQVFRCIRELLQDSKLVFSLRVPPSKDITENADGGKTLEELKLVPSAIFNFLPKKGSSASLYLKPDVLKSKKALEAVPIPKAINEVEIQKALNELVPASKKPSKKKPKRNKPKPSWQRWQDQLGDSA